MSAYPPFRASEEQRKTVRAMSAYGITQLEIANILGISRKTLELHFRRELDTATAEANAKVAQSLFKLATDGGNVTAAIFWLKTRARWTERLIIQDGEDAVDPATLNDAELSDRISRLRGIAAARGATAPETVPEQPNGLLH